MKKIRNKRVNYYRLAIQYTITALLGYMLIRWIFDSGYTPDFETYCPIGGMQSLSSYLAINSLACSMSSMQIIMGIMLGVGVLLISKLFCSYICPIGIFTEWLGRLGSRFKVRYTITGVADSVLRSLKYILLFITFYFTVSSSELFCRQFDPYYAVMTGFSKDVNVYYALITIAITVFGSFFIRQFWCKYLCPLGAAANIFAFAPVFIAILLIYWLLVSVAGIQLHWFWLLGAVCLAGLILEVCRRQGMYFPLLRINRNPEICTNCKICDKVCPYALPVSTSESVRHIDCHMCVDCVVKCPEKGALTINRRRWTWLPASILLVLIIAGMLIAARWELPTINVRWGSAEQFETATIYEQEGLKDIKCFGSASSFATQMQKVEGVIGVQAFAKRYAVKIWYDPAVIDPHAIREAIFAPVNWMLAEPSPDMGQIAAAELGIDKFFDSQDAFLLSELLVTEPGVFGMETSFGEPVHTLVYYDPQLLDLTRIKAMIEAPSVTYGEGEEATTQKTEFKVAYTGPQIRFMSAVDYLKKAFKPYSVRFNESEKYNSAQTATMEMPVAEAMRGELQRWFPFLMSHVSNDDGVIGFLAEWTSEVPFVRLTYVPSLTTPEKIKSLVLAPKLSVHYPDGSVREFDNPFTFSIKP